MNLNHQLPIGLTAAAGIHKKIFGSGNTTLIISNKGMNDITQIVKQLEESGLLIKGVREAIKNEVKEQKGEFLGMSLGTLGASLLGNLLTGKGAQLELVKTQLELARIFNATSFFKKL